MTEYRPGTQIDLGAVLVTVAEPWPEERAEYNRWFEHEHMYSAMLIGPGAFAAERYVATRPRKEQRYPRDGGIFADVGTGSYVALYFIVDGAVDEHFAWGFPRSAWLGEQGRNNPHRDLLMTWLCDHVGVVARDERTPPPHVALDRRYGGLVTAFIRRDPDVELDDLRRWLEDECLPQVLAGSGIDQALVLAARDLPDPGATPTTPGTVKPNPEAGQVLVVCFFTEGDPDADWDERFETFGDRVEEGGRGHLALLAPWIPVVMGTDTYADEL